MRWILKDFLTNWLNVYLFRSYLIHNNYKILPELHCKNLKLGVSWWVSQSSLFAAQVSHCPPDFLPLPTNTLESWLWEMWSDLPCWLMCMFADLILPKSLSLYEVRNCGDNTIYITWNSRNLGKTNFLMHSLASRVLLFWKQDTSLQLTGELVP